MKFIDEASETTVFQHEQFGQVRTMILDGEPWFDAVDVVRCRDCVCAGPLKDGAEKYFQSDCLLCSMGRGDPSLGYSVVLPDDFCSDGININVGGENENSSIHL